MAYYPFYIHIVFSCGLFILSCVFCTVMVKYFRIMDIPNKRSSHEMPTPKSGGIVIVMTFVIGFIAIYLSDPDILQKQYAWGFFIASLLIAATSFYDDLKNRPFLFKLTWQIIAVVIVMASGIVIREFNLPCIGHIQLGTAGYIITFLWVIGLTNAYNFMDGLNGMAAGPGVITGVFLCLITFLKGSTFVYIICYTLIAGTAGFMVFNFPIARLFMGDVGSAFLGFVFANLAVIAAYYDHSHTSLFVIPLLLFNFIYDTLFTFFHRVIRKEDVFSAHRRHLYQLFNRLGYSHVTVSSFHFAVCMAQGIGACIMVMIKSNERVFIFVPFLFFQVIYTLIIVRRAVKAGLI